jgi:hypothetical protein
MKYKNLTILWTIGLLMVSSCGVKQTTPSDKSEQQRLALMMEALEGFVSNTPYCALIKHTSVDVVPVPDPYPDDGYVEEKHIYHAKVLETFRGQQMENISYMTITEKGEGANISTEPTVITLCKDKEGFWGLGTGSTYPATEEVVKVARRIGQKVKSSKKSFSFCE